MELMSVFSLKSFKGGVADLTAYQLDTPIIGDMSDDEVYERDYIEVTIDNYDKEAEYEANSELITKIRYKSDNVVKVYFGSVDDDTNLDFKIRSLKVGYLASEWSDTLSVTVKDRPEESDDAIINDAFEDNLDDSDSADVTNDKVTITADGGYYKEVVTEQGDDETDWSSYQSYCEIELDKMTIIDDDTTKDELVVKEDIRDITKCYITNDDYPDGLLIDVGDVDRIEGSINDLDILGDDSGLYCYNLEDNTELGGADGVICDKDGNEVDGVFDNGKYNKGLVLNNDNSAYFKTGFDSLDDSDLTISFWYKYDDSDDNSCIFTSTRESDDKRMIAMFVNTSSTDNTGFAVYVDDDLKTKIEGNLADKLKDKNWHHLVFTSNGNIYIDNNLEFENQYDYDATELNSCFYFGCQEDETHLSKGMIDQIRFLSKNTDDNEVDTLYNETLDYFKADISSNNLENPPKTAYFEEASFTLSTALTKDTNPTDDDFVDEEVESFKIDTDTDLKEVTFKKVSDYSGNKFQRKFSGDENANVTYIKSNMWKDS
jgi:hypothetical protein